MTEVALAAGFGSVRRFNETFRGLYGRPPSRIAARAPRPPAPIGSRRSTLKLGLRAAVRLGGDDRVPRARARSPASRWSTAERYRRTFALDGAHGTIEVAPLAGRAALAVAIRLPRTCGRLPSIVARVRRVFDLGADVSAIDAHLARDRAAGTARRRAAGPARAGRVGRVRAGGARDARPADHGRRQRAMLAGKLVAAYGEPLEAALADAASGLTHVFPTPARLARRDHSRRSACRGRGRRRSRRSRRAAADDPRLFERAREPRRGDRAPPRAARHRRLDGAVRRDARAARARRVSRRPIIGLLRAMRERRRHASDRRRAAERAPRRGGRGAPTRRNISGPPTRRPARRRTLRGGRRMTSTPALFRPNASPSPIGAIMLVCGRGRDASRPRLRGSRAAPRASAPPPLRRRRCPNRGRAPHGDSRRAARPTSRATSMRSTTLAVRDQRHAVPAPGVGGAARDSRRRRRARTARSRSRSARRRRARAVGLANGGESDRDRRAVPSRDRRERHAHRLRRRPRAQALAARARGAAMRARRGGRHEPLAGVRGPLPLAARSRAHPRAAERLGRGQRAAHRVVRRRGHRDDELGRGVGVRLSRRRRDPAARAHRGGRARSRA